jgi:hypothetical protein
MDSYEVYLWIDDIEHDTPIVTSEILDSANAATTQPRITLVPTTVGPYNWLLKYTPTTVIHDSVKSASETIITEVYQVKLTVKDSISTLPVNTYTITMSINNKDNAPTYIGTDNDLVLHGWTVGVPPASGSFPVIPITLFSDIDNTDVAILTF